MIPPDELKFFDFKEMRRVMAESNRLRVLEQHRVNDIFASGMCPKP